MSTTEPQGWRDLLETVVHAASLEDAQLATSELIDTVLPGGAVLDADAAALVREVRAAADVAENPYRAYVVGVLAAMASWAHVWQGQVDGGNTSEAARSGAEAERETAGELSRACDDLGPLSNDGDPEVRGIMYLLIGGAGTPLRDMAELLRERAAGEGEELARACAYQALVKVAARASAGQAAEIGSWLTEALRSESDVVGRRLRAELESNARTPTELRRLETALGIYAVDLPPGPVPMWTAEGV